jgi:hypothetical protein
MGAHAASRLHMLVVRPCIAAYKQIFGLTSIVSVFGRALGSKTGFVSCARITSAHLLSIRGLQPGQCRRVVCKDCRLAIPIPTVS